MNDSSRPSWDETWINVARVVAHRSLCERDKIGAVIVDPRMRIVATGYNGPPSGFTLPDRLTANRPCAEWCPRSATADWIAGKPPYENGEDFPKWANAGFHGPHPDYSDCPSLHAEANALSVCERFVRENGTIYVTGDICFGCAKLIANSGLARVVIDGVRPAIHRNPARSREFLVTCGLAVVVV